MTDLPAPPSFLQRQATAAKAKAQEARKAILDAKHNANPQTTNPTRQPINDQADKPIPNPTKTSPTSKQSLNHTQKPPNAPHNPKTKKQSVKGETALAGVEMPTAFKGDHLGRVLEVAMQLDDLEVIDLWRTHSPNQAAFTVISPFIPNIMATIISGAMIRGAQGMGDRMTLFRMLGAPWTPTTSSRGETGQQVEALADRFVRAVARKERMLSSGRVSDIDEVVTIDIPAYQADLTG